MQALTILISDVTSHKELERILQELRHQSDQNFNVALILNDNSPKLYATIEQALVTFGQRLSFMVNNKSRTTQVDLRDIWHRITTDYMFVTSCANSFKPNVIKNLNQALAQHQPDIFEFAPEFCAGVRWKPKSRLAAEFYPNLQASKELYAYAFPFLFNKVFKTKLFQQLHTAELYVSNDSTFYSLLSFLLMQVAQSYQFDETTYVTVTIDNNAKLPITSYYEDMKKIELMVRSVYPDLVQEVNYNVSYFLQVVLLSMLEYWHYPFGAKLFKEKDRNSLVSHNNRAKMLLKKNIEKRNKSLSKDLLANKYMQLHNPEAEFLNLDFIKTLPQGDEQL
ncbi:hypothetical protein [Mycoplasmopsis columbinasalis]|uniref:Glycosyltransferase n=1 Tax=Mycoplasmopsis columbinasalis TaxID=114880 RepID=A0A449B9L8_9BACT|nr:hypothetical protein [Mycoplasmopsis columbinasalis]VEU77853.1 Uncharacterised protein [Mycoplasmopsis columbinasalis]